MDVGSLRDQWLRIIDRGPQRGERFLPLETVLCCAASLVVNHHRYGGRTNHLAPSPVPELARLFNRTHASILLKMANVDGSQQHGASIDVPIGIHVLGRPENLAQIYADAFTAARSVGIDETRLPDFLDLEIRRDVQLLGQEEIEPALVSAVEERANLYLAAGLDEPQTVRLAEVNLRVGQHRFAREVLTNYGHVCAFCRLDPPQALEVTLLRASHVKPWRDSTASERLDLRRHCRLPHARRGFRRRPTDDQRRPPHPCVGVFG